MRKMPVRTEPSFTIPREIQRLADRPDPGDETAEPFGWRQPARFVLAGVRRRKLLVSTIFLLAMGASVVALRLLPKSYHVETRLLAQKPSAMPAAVRQGSGGPEDAPTKSAYDLVHRHDNLEALVKQTNLDTFAGPRKTLLQRLGLSHSGDSSRP